MYVRLTKVPLNMMSVYTNTTATMPKYNTTSSINNLASGSAFLSAVMDNIINCVKSHITLSKWNPY